MQRPNTIKTIRVPTPSGELELLACLPQPGGPPGPWRRPILFLHGVFCSAHDFENFLLYLAARGHPAYSLSIRAHGSSWTPGWCRLMFLTTMADYAADAAAGLEYVTRQHPGLLPIVAGHSLGGGVWQYMLANRGRKKRPQKMVAGLILVGAAPATGGGRTITGNWEEANEAPGWYSYPWSPQSLLGTPMRVRNAFFGPQTEERVVLRWMKECRTVQEGLRAGFRLLWRLGKEKDILASIEGFGGFGGKGSGDEEAPAGEGRKILSIAAEGDKLVKKEMVLDNSAEYRKALGLSKVDGQDSAVVTDKVLAHGGHHMMMDVAWEQCAAAIAEWVKHA